MHQAKTIPIGPRVVLVVILLATPPAVGQPRGEPQPQSQPAPAPLQVAPTPPPSPFDQHRIRLGLGAGGGSYDGNTYFALELGAGYFVLRGLEIGLDLTQWFGTDPNVTQLSPQVRYVFYQLLRAIPVAPYVGGFYRHWFFWEGRSDFDTLGARAGAILGFGGHAYLGFGGAYERVVSRCDNGCDTFYPELTLALVF